MENVKNNFEVALRWLYAKINLVSQTNQSFFLYTSLAEISYSNRCERKRNGQRVFQMRIDVPFLDEYFEADASSILVLN